MRRLSTCLPCLTFALTLPVMLAGQTVIVNYTFEGTTAAVTGSAISTVTWNSGGSTSYPSPFSGQGQALAVSDFQSGEYFQITLDGTGYGGIALASFRTNAASGSAPRDWTISYSLTGISGPFTELATYTLSSSTGGVATTVDGQTLPSGADNSSSIVLRFIASSSTRVDGAGGVANGTVRLDNVAFTASAIPEPSTYAVLAGALGLALAGLHRARAQKSPPGGGP